MSIFGRLQNLSVTDEKAWNPSLWNLIGSKSLSGEVVTEETALTYSAVFNAVSLIAGTVGSLPLHLMQKAGELKETVENSLYYAMHSKWNPYITAMAGREAMMAHVLTWGNGFAEIVRNRMGDIVELWPIAPNRVKIEWDNGLIYRINVVGEDVTLDRGKILHIPGLGFDGFTGYSVISLARKSIGLGMAMETFGALYFGNGTHPSAVVTHPTSLKDPKAFREAVTAVYGGLGKSHQLMVLEEGMKLEKVGIPPEDSQFLESRQFQIPEIARWFNLPPHKLKDLTKSSFNNIESEQTSFVMDSILPWLVRLEQSYNVQLLTEIEQKRKKYYFKHIIEGLLRANAKDRAEFYQKMWGFGAMSINEIRGKEDLNPITGGDEHFVPLNYIPLSQAGKQLATQQKTGGNDNEGQEP